MFKAKLTAAIVALLVIPAHLLAGSVQTSSTTAQTIINNARVLIQEVTADHWSDVTLLRYVNEGTVDIAAQTLATQATEDISLVADQLEYSITTNYITVEHVNYIDADGVVKGLDKGHPADLQKVGESDMRTPRPAFWYEWGGKIGIFPTLSAVTTETVKLYLISRPAAVAVDAAVTTPAVYDRALVRYVAAQALLDKRRFADSDHLMKEYQSEIDRYRQDFNELDKK
jgi:hypothetical protein